MFGGTIERAVSFSSYAQENDRGEVKSKRIEDNWIERQACKFFKNEFKKWSAR